MQPIPPLRTLDEFYTSQSSDIFDKCKTFYDYVEQARAHGLYDVQYRVTLGSALDHRITVMDRKSGNQREMICFDSNSYLGLHLHPRVLEAVRSALRRVGAGTPSAQVLGGTNRYLRELEETVSAFHHREETLIFPSGYSANIGLLTALLRDGDLVARDRFCHASLHDGCRFSDATLGGVYQHNDMNSLEALLMRDAAQAKGKAIVTDGVFSMHGNLAPLPELRKLADRYAARLIVDEAHALGVLGPNGGGLEDHYNTPGSIDVLVGTFSKASGSMGGYVCATREVIEYLRFFARSGLFTATLPAAICAGLTQTFRIMNEEPQHREHLQKNTQRFRQHLLSEGFNVALNDVPIVPIAVGDEGRLAAMATALYDAGIKCGTVSYPAVPRGSSILRFTVNARHTADDLDYTVETLARMAKQHALFHTSPNESMASL